MESALRVLVCFSVTPDFDDLFRGDWEIDGKTVDAKYSKKVLGVYDESALELALGLCADATNRGQAVSLTAVNISGEDNKAILKNLFAVGYDEVARINPGRAILFSHGEQADLLTRYFRWAGGFDCVIIGRQDSVSADVAVPFIVAETLGIPCIDSVTEISPGPFPGSLSAVCEALGRVTRLTVRVPVLIAVGETMRAHLRVPTLRDKMNAAKREVAVVEADSLPGAPAPEQRETLMKLIATKKDRSCEFIEGSAREQARILWERYLRKETRP